MGLSLKICSWEIYLPAEKCHWLVSLLVEGDCEVVVLGHEGGLQYPVYRLYPVPPLLLRVGRELEVRWSLSLRVGVSAAHLVCPVRSVQYEAVALFSKSWSEARHYQVSRPCVTQKYFSLKCNIGQRSHHVPPAVPWDKRPVALHGTWASSPPACTTSSCRRHWGWGRSCGGDPPWCSQTRGATWALTRPPSNGE